MKKTRVVFYARVSKDTEEQLHSFEAQKKYFEEFISRNKDMVFIRGYADEGISGVNVKKRKQFQQMIEDAFVKKGVDFEKIDTYHLPSDFAVYPHFPEGDYLKVYFYQVKK